MGKLEDAAFVGALAPMAAVPFIPAYQGNKILQERKQKEESKKVSKEEELKRSKEPSGSDSETKATPKTYKSGGKVSSASKRADGCAIKGKTKGRMV
jgi:hypothetical protein